jgi:hypothetical protein
MSILVVACALRQLQPDPVRSHRGIQLILLDQAADVASP